MCLTPSSSQQKRERDRRGERERHRDACNKRCPSGGSSVASRGEEEGKNVCLMFFDTSTIPPADLLHVFGPPELLSSQSVYK